MQSINMIGVKTNLNTSAGLNVSLLNKSWCLSLLGNGQNLFAGYQGIPSKIDEEINESADDLTQVDFRVT